MLLTTAQQVLPYWLCEHGGLAILADMPCHDIAVLRILLSAITAYVEPTVAPPMLPGPCMA
jgi:hypothetical protein